MDAALRSGSVFGRILVATDGSATARIAVDRAADLARALGSSLAIVSAAAGEAEATTVVEAEVARLAEAGVAAEGLARSGDPASVIVGEAERGSFDLVVVGNQGMTGPRVRGALGSVPNKVSHAIGCSLLVVRTTA